jgi:hypothetical protein
METHLEISPRGWFLRNVVESPSANDLKACLCNVVKSPVQIFIRGHLHPICIRAVKAENSLKRSVPGHIRKVTDPPAVEVKLSVLDCDEVIRPPLQLCAMCNKELEGDHQKQSCVQSHADGNERWTLKVRKPSLLPENNGEPLYSWVPVDSAHIGNHPDPE